MRSKVRPATHDDVQRAGELHDAHPVRFTNEGLRLDHKPENAIEWYVKIRTTGTTTSGCQHNRIPNNGTGWKR